MAAATVFFAAIPFSMAEGISADASAACGQADCVSLLCSYSLNGEEEMKRPNILYDGSLRTKQKLGPDTFLQISIPEETDTAKLFLSFYSMPVPYSVTEYDSEGNAITCTRPETDLLMPVLPVSGNTSVITVVPEASCTISECSLYTAGSDPAAFHTFSKTSDKLDYLIVSAHPDDEQLYLGGVAPICSDRGLKGTILYMTCNRRERYTESLNACYTAGIRQMPLFLWLEDGTVKQNMIWKHWDRDAVLLDLVRVLRRTRPEVVVTHHFGGEYGQGLHIATAEAVAESVQLAADSTYDPGAEPWQVKKLYIHMHDEITVTLPVNDPLPSFKGRTALEVTREAFRKHRSEFKKLHLEANASGPYDLSKYGLYYTTVGPDTGKNDLFENIPDSCLTRFCCIGGRAGA